MAQKIKDDNDIDFVDQGLTHHIFTFKTNHLFLRKDSIELNEVASQTLGMISNEDNNHVCFNA